MQQSSRNRLAIAFTHLIGTLGLVYLPATIAAQHTPISTESADLVEESTVETTAATSDTDSTTNAPKAVQVVNRYDDLLSSDKTIRERAFDDLFGQIYQLRDAQFDFLGNPEELISVLSKTLLSDNKDVAAWSAGVIAHIASVSGSFKLAEERGMDVQVYSYLVGPYQQFEKFGVNDILAKLAGEGEGNAQQYAIIAIVSQDVMSEENDDLIADTFRSPKTDDDTLSTILVALAGSVYRIPGTSYQKRPISSQLAAALYELLSYDGISPVRSSASKVLAWSNSKNARDVVLDGLIAAPNDEVFERSLWILRQHDSAELKKDPRLSIVMKSLMEESRKQAYSNFVQSLD